MLLFKNLIRFIFILWICGISINISAQCGASKCTNCKGSIDHALFYLDHSFRRYCSEACRDGAKEFDEILARARRNRSPYDDSPHPGLDLLAEIGSDVEDIEGLVAALDGIGPAGIREGCRSG